MKRSTLIICALAAGILTAVEVSLAGDLQAELQKQYAVTQFDPNGGVTQAGTVLIVQQGGAIKAIPATYRGYFSNTMKTDGHIKPNMVQHIGRGAANAGQSPLHPAYLDEARLLDQGEKVYIAEVRIEKDSDVVFKVQSCGACTQGVQGAAPFRAALNIQFPKAYLASADLSQVTATIDRIFAVDPSLAPGQSGASCDVRECCDACRSTPAQPRQYFCAGSVRPGKSRRFQGFG